MYKDLLKQYKEIDMKIINSLKSDNNEFIDLFDKRELVIREIISCSEYKDEIKKDFCNMKLNELDEKIKRLLVSNMLDIKSKIQKIKMGQKALNGYSAAKRMPNFYTRIL